MIEELWLAVALIAGREVALDSFPTKQSCVYGGAWAETLASVKAEAEHFDGKVRCVEFKRTGQEADARTGQQADEEGGR